MSKREEGVVALQTPGHSVRPYGEQTKRPVFQSPSVWFTMRDKPWR